MPKRKLIRSTDEQVIPDSHIQLYTILNASHLDESPVEIFNKDYQRFEAIHQSGIGLDDALIKNGNTIIHCLITHEVSLYLIQRLINQLGPINLETTNAKKETYLLTAIKVRYIACANWLIDMGANPLAIDSTGKSTLDYCKQFNVQLKSRKEFISVHDKLQELAIKAKPVLALLAFPEKIMRLYSILLEFINSKKWQYNPNEHDYGDSRCILDADHNGRYVVNCVDMAKVFREMLHFIDIKEVTFYCYKDIYSKRVDIAHPNITGKMTCFDKEYHDIILAAKGYFDFSKHCVIQLKEGFFDPTMGCLFKNADDIIDDQVIEEEHESVFIRAYDSLGEFLTFPAGFIAELQKDKQWEILVHRKSLICIKKANRLWVDVTECGEFTFSQPDVQGILDLIKVWMKTEVRELSFSIEYDAELTGETIKQGLIANGINTKIYLNQRDLSDAEEAEEGNEEEEASEERPASPVYQPYRDAHLQESVNKKAKLEEELSESLLDSIESWIASDLKS